MVHYCNLGRIACRPDQFVMLGSTADCSKDRATVFSSAALRASSSVDREFCTELFFCCLPPQSACNSGSCQFAGWFPHRRMGINLHWSLVLQSMTTCQDWLPLPKTEATSEARCEILDLICQGSPRKIAFRSLTFWTHWKKLVQKGELALAAGKSPILFFWHSGHGLQVHEDALPHLVASDSEPDSVDTLVDTDYLVAKLNEVRAEKNCKLRVIIVLDCCRFQSKGPTTSVTINRRQKLPSLKYDFYIILACDPGRGAADFEHGGVLTQEVLRLLPYRKPILQIFHEVEKRVKCQCPWVRSRAGDDEPVLGTRDNEDFPNRSPRGRTETAQLLGIEDDMYSPHSPQSPQCLDSDSLSACDTFRLYWFPFAGLLAVGCHAVLLTLWVFGVGINKRHATRLAMPPCMALMDLASLSQAYYRRLSELKPSCGLACSVFLHQVWPKLECHLNRAYYPSLFLMLAVGELKRDRDVLAAICNQLHSGSGLLFCRVQV